MDETQSKPFYKKWWVWLLGLFILGGLGSSGGSSTSASASSNAQPSSASVATQDSAPAIDPVGDYIARLDRELEGLRTFSPDKHTSSREGILITAGVLFGAWATMAEEAQRYELTSEQQATVDRFKSQASRAQRDAFPRLRDAYGPVVRKALWEQDIEARTLGSGYRTIELTGAFFAANRNKQQVQDSISDTLHMLRFTQSRYKWYSMDDKYTYYTMDPPSDGDLVIWDENGNHRVVE